MERKLIFFVLVIGILGACKKKDPTPQYNLIFKFKFNPNQERLDNFGNRATIPAGNAGQSPQFNWLTAHYFELAPTAFTQIGQGTILYHASETTLGGETAIDFDKSVFKKEDEIYLSVPLSQIAPKTYEYLRISFAYQNYDITFRVNGVDYIGTVASFVGYNTYIRDVKIKNQTISVNANKKQGFWAFETLTGVLQGQAPGTTVPNPIAATSPIPPGSCVVTAKFDTPLQITGQENKNIIITVSVSNNKSFEWKDNNGNGHFEPTLGETVVDMGIRGMKMIVE
ncbi:hypothetical protein [Raineya orbicola]|jgi:hypothetical protein|uniref:Uncharacterized protein n=1 Tax=Raineya orbicola TaxID=2016530 RepID=A0A2N3IGD4_9BACT|nr:hypothetical protein [Raineya orbicola]PKQ69293.1 hypothetical protein Rain11_1446 [Raineya orbicola]